MLSQTIKSVTLLELFVVKRIKVGTLCHGEMAAC